MYFDTFEMDSGKELFELSHKVFISVLTIIAGKFCYTPYLTISFFHSIMLLSRTICRPVTICLLMASLTYSWVTINAWLKATLSIFVFRSSIKFFAQISITVPLCGCKNSYRILHAHDLPSLKIVNFTKVTIIMITPPSVKTSRPSVSKNELSWLWTVQWSRSNMIYPDSQSTHSN